MNKNLFVLLMFFYVLPSLRANDFPCLQVLLPKGNLIRKRCSECVGLFSFLNSNGKSCQELEECIEEIREKKASPEKLEEFEKNREQWPSMWNENIRTLVSHSDAVDNILSDQPDSVKNEEFLTFLDAVTKWRNIWQFGPEENAENV